MAEHIDRWNDSLAVDQQVKQLLSPMSLEDKINLVSGKLTVADDGTIPALHVVAAANPRTVVVLMNAGPVETASWETGVPAVLEAWYAGQEQGNAVASVLFGDSIRQASCRSRSRVLKSILPSPRRPSTPESMVWCIIPRVFLWDIGAMTNWGSNHTIRSAMAYLTLALRIHISR